MLLDLETDRTILSRSLREWVDKECPKNWALELERQEHRYPYELWDKMTEIGLHGLAIPEEYGGTGGGPVEAAIAARELSRNLGGLAWVWAISAFAGARAIGTAGSEAQKAEHLPRLAAGERRYAIAATEPSGGTDLLGAMTTRAVTHNGGWLINGQKMWTTGANEADYLLLIAKTSEPLNGSRHPGTTVFLVPRESIGLECRFIPKIGMRAVGSCEVFLDDVYVEDDAVLGEVDEGFKALVATLNHERVISAAMALGMLDGVIEEAVAYAMQRETFGKVIGSRQIIQHYIADMVIWQKQAELLTFDVARREAEGLPINTEAKIAKVATSEYTLKAADLGMQILGGMGLSQETHMQRYWRDVRQFCVAPISNEVARNSIAESLGLPRSY
jgi:acyl-CoA dehydrogenase